jgi:hypothetical protein
VVGEREREGEGVTLSLARCRRSPNYSVFTSNGIIGGAIGKIGLFSGGTIGNGTVHDTDWFNRRACNKDVQRKTTIGALKIDRPLQGFLMRFAGRGF